MEPLGGVVEIFKALAHPVRLQILRQLLIDGEACVCHLEARLGQRQAYISQQLAKLRQADLVCDRREGLNVYYAVSTEAVGQLIDLALTTVDDPSVRQAKITELAIMGQAQPNQCSCPKCEPSSLEIGE